MERASESISGTGAILMFGYIKVQYSIGVYLISFSI